MFLYAFFLRKEHINIECIHLFFYYLLNYRVCVTAPTVTCLFICIFPSFFGDLPRAGTRPAPTTFAMDSFLGCMQYILKLFYMLFLFVSIIFHYLFLIYCLAPNILIYNYICTLIKTKRHSFTFTTSLYLNYIIKISTLELTKSVFQLNYKFSIVIIGRTAHEPLRPLALPEESTCHKRLPPRMPPSPTKCT